MISQITPAGLKPASRARSTAASVCPARCRTPPGRALKGKTCPGITRSSGPVASSTATRQVCARSAAEMPVEMPSFASMETVKAVPMREELWVTICGTSRRSTISSAIGKQMSPLPCVAMKLMSSGVTSSAAMVRSPSFSRSSSSQTMTILPALTSSMISSIGLNGIFDAPLEISHPSNQPRLDQPLHVFRYDIRLQVHASSRSQRAKVRVGSGLRQNGGGERTVAHRDDGEAYTVYADAPFFDGVAQHALRRLELPDLCLALRTDADDLPDAVHVPLHDVPPEPPFEAHCALQVDEGPLGEVAQGCAPERLRHNAKGERAAPRLVDRQADAVHRHAVAPPRVFEDAARGDLQAVHLPHLQPDHASH